MSDTSTSLSLPSLALLFAICFVAARWLLKSSPSSSPSNGRPSARNQYGQAAPSVNIVTANTLRRPVDRIKVAQVQAMFPQLPPRTIAWALQRHSGNVQAVVETALQSGGDLEQPPQSFQPVGLDTSPTRSSASGSTAARAPLPDLIQRYNLSSKLQSSGLAASESSDGSTESAKGVASTSGSGSASGGTRGTASGSGWGATKTERAALLAARRDAMILKARRDMEAKVKSEQDKGKAAVGRAG